MSDSELQKATERRLVEALPLLEQKLELRKATLGLEHRSTLKSMDMLARAYKYAGRKAELLPLFEQALELRKVAFGLEDWDTRTLMEKLAFEYQLAGRVSDALPQATTQHARGDGDFDQHLPRGRPAGDGSSDI